MLVDALPADTAYGFIPPQRWGTLMPDNAPDLSISTEKLCFIIAKARQFDAKDVMTDPDDSSNPADDAMLSVLEDHRDALSQLGISCDE